MEPPSPNKSTVISAFFLSLFFAYGALFPLFSLYLKDLHFSGTEIGVILSINPLMMFLAQPLWGYLCDITKRPQALLVTTMTLTASIVIFFPSITGFKIFILITIFFSFFQSAIDPISTSLIMSYTDKYQLPFGDFRMWGAAGFAISIWVLGQLSHIYTLKIIFYNFSLFLALSIIFVWKIPNYLRSNIKSITKVPFKELLSIKSYLIFLIANFLIFGPMLANNVFYGLWYENLGGSLSGVGVSFLLSIGSEIPFMKVAKKLVNRFGLLPVLIFASFTSAIQYLCFYLQPPISYVYVLNIVQGFSLGVFIPVSLQYVQENSPHRLQTTAVGIFNGVGVSLGNWFFTLMGGFVLEYTHIEYVYLLFSLVSLLGMAILFTLRYTQQKLSTNLS